MPKSYCDNCGITHTALMCFNKPRLPIRPKRNLTWEQTKIKWIILNPADQYGLWECYLKIAPNCLRRMDRQQLVLDHIKPKGSFPEIAYDMDNLGPVCFYCNSLKGSRSLESLAKDYPQLNHLVNIDTD